MGMTGKANEVQRARYMLIASMVVFGTISIFVRNISLASGEVALYRALLGVLLIGGYFVVSRRRLTLRGAGSAVLLLLFSGGAMGINWLLLFEAYKYTTVSVATLSYYFAPVIVTVACPLLFHEKMTWRQVVCFVMSTVGLVLVIGIGDLLSGGADMRGVAFGLGAAVFYSVVMLLNKFITGVDDLSRTFWQFLAAALVLLPYVALTDGCNIGALDGIGWVSLLVVGLVHTGITYCMYFAALKDLPGQETAVLCYIDPLVAVLVSVCLLGEAITPGQVAGGALILGFALWNELSLNRADRVNRAE